MYVNLLFLKKIGIIVTIFGSLICMTENEKTVVSDTVNILIYKFSIFFEDGNLYK